MPIYARTRPKPLVVTIPSLNIYVPSLRMEQQLSDRTGPKNDRYPPIKDDLQLSDPIPAHINYQQIVKTVLEWFESWRPWQQRLVLCGITNRCSTGQLESLATTLEPLFHRYFLASFIQKYPTLTIKHDMVSSKGKKVKPKLDTETNLSIDKGEIKVPSPTKCPSSGKVIYHENEPHITREMTRSETDLMQKLTLLEKEIEVEEKERVYRDKISDYAENITSSILDDILDTRETIRTVEDYATELVAKVISDAQTTLAARKKAEHLTSHSDSYPLLTDVLGNLQINATDMLGNLKKSSEVPASRDTCCRTSPKHEHESSSYPIQKIRAKPSKKTKQRGIGQSPRKEDLFMKDGGSVSKHHNSLARYPSLLPCRKSSRLRNLTPNPDTAATRRRMESALFHSHRNTQIAAITKMTRSVDFFRGDRFPKLGSVQAELRSGSVKRPALVQDLYIPMQKMYKNAKWFNEMPMPGKTFVKPQKSALQQAYGLQTNQLWKWIESWEDHQRQTLLVELIKLCSQSMMNYLAQCLFQRMKERIDVNWLPDQLLLLVFSNLSLEDIDSCSKVCNRWKHLCASDELWMYKCHEFGCQVGIPDMIDRVEASNEDGSQIDWRVALMEVRDLVTTAKNTTPGINDLASLVATPTNMKRVDGKFIDEDDAPIVEEPPKKGLAARLRMESEKLRQAAEQRAGISSKIEEGIGLRDSLGSDTSQKSDEIWNAREKAREKLLGRPSDSGNAPLVAGQTTVEGEHGGSHPGSRVESWLQDGPLRMFSSRKKGVGDQGERAHDVRPELLQQPDLLNLSPNWVEGNNGMTVRRPVGKVEALKRCRKFLGHMDAVLCVSFDSRRLISGSMDRSIRIWDIRSGQSIHKLYGHKGGVSCVNFEKDVLISGSWDMAIMIWNLITFERTGILTGHRGSISCIEVSDKYIFSGSHDCTVRVWGKRTMTIRKVIRGHKSHVLCMAMDGDHLISGSSDKTIRITDIEQEECLHVLSASSDPVQRLALKGSLIVSANSIGEVWFWNKDSGKAEAAIKAHKGPITSIVFREGRCFTASSDMTIKEWDLYSLTCVRSLLGHKAAINNLAVSYQRAVSCSADGHIRVWDFFNPTQTLGNGPEDDIPTQLVHQTARK